MHPIIRGLSDGPPLVLLHGWGGSNEIWEALSYTKLASHYRLIALNLPGVGRTPFGDTEGLPDRMAADILRQLDDLGIEKFAILGHSQGANVAGWMALQSPDSVTHLIMVSPALYLGRLAGSAYYLNPKFGRATLGFLRELAGIAGEIERKLPPVKPNDLGFIRGYMRRSGPLKWDNEVAPLLQSLQALIDQPFDVSKLPTDLPVLLMHGGRDDTLPVEHTKEAYESRPLNSTLSIYEQAYHCPMDTHLDRFVQEVLEFLDTPARNSP